MEEIRKSQKMVYKLSLSVECKLPESISNLHYLEELTLKNCKLTADALKPLSNLSNLKYLNLNGNYIEEIPESIGKFSNMKVLRYGNNNLEEGEIEKIKKNA